MELFIWAVLTNKATLIDFFWRRCGSPLLMSIIGAGMYSKLSHFYNENNKQIKILSDRKLQFIRRANRVSGQLSRACSTRFAMTQDHVRMSRENEEFKEETHFSRSL